MTSEGGTKSKYVSIILFYFFYIIIWINWLYSCSNTAHVVHTAVAFFYRETVTATDREQLRWMKCAAQSPLNCLVFFFHAVHFLTNHSKATQMDECNNKPVMSWFMTDMQTVLKQVISCITKQKQRGRTSLWIVGRAERNEVWKDVKWGAECLLR